MQTVSEPDSEPPARPPAEPTEEPTLHIRPHGNGQGSFDQSASQSQSVDWSVELHRSQILRRIKIENAEGNSSGNLSNQLHRLYDSNATEIISLLRAPVRRAVRAEAPSEAPTQTHVYEDVEMSYTNFLIPFVDTEPELTKRENDDFSGAIPYNDNVSIYESIYFSQQFNKLWI